MELVSGGYDRPEADLPIDVHYHLLNDWLVDRGVCDAGWAHAVNAIRAAISAALADMPDVPEMTALLAGAYITYPHVLRIIDILRTSEADTRGFFGTYGSQRMKDWAAIQASYERGTVYRGEMAHILHQLVKYDVPAARKAARMADAAVVSLRRKGVEYARAAAAFRAKYARACADLGIAGSSDRDGDGDGDDVASQLRALLAAGLDGVYTSVVAAARTASVRDALALYAAFAAWTGATTAPASILPVLAHVIGHGNDTVAAYVGVEAPPLVVEAAEAGDGGGIDWGADNGAADDDGGGGGGGIDWGDAAAAAAADDGGGADIDWGDLDMDGGAAAAGDDGVIDWGDDDDAVVDDAAEAGDAAAAVGAHAADDDDDASSSLRAFPRSGPALRESLLQCQASRTAFVNDVSELETFLVQRIEEMRTLDAAKIAAQAHDAPPIVQKFAHVAAAETALADVRAVLHALTSPRARHLLLMNASAAYLARLAASVTFHARNADKLDAKAAGLEERIAVQQVRAAEASAALTGHIKRIRDLQKLLEDDLQRQFGRPFHIIGEINNIVK